MPDRRIQFAKTAVDTIYGPAGTEWQVNHAGFHLTVTIPCNTAAEIHLPDGEMHTWARETGALHALFRKTGMHRGLCGT